MAVDTDFESYISAVRTAIAAGDFSAARTQLALAEATLALIPDVGSDTVSARYRNNISSLRAAINDLDGRAAGRTNVLQFSRVTNVEPT